MFSIICSEREKYEKRIYNITKKLTLWSPTYYTCIKTYAIVDSLRDETVKEKIPWSGLNYLDLWHEDLWENELEVPLYLVELEEDNEFTEYLLANSDKNVASYLISPYRLEVLQHYYSFFTYPEMDKECFEIYGRNEPAPEGAEWSRQVLSGFYDASVLAGYIPSLYSQEKIDEFFAGVAMWLVPNAEDEEKLYLAFRDKNGEVDDVNLDLTQLREIEAPVLSFDTVSFPTVPNLEDYAHEVTLDLKQMELFEQRHRRKFIDNVFYWAKRDGWAFRGEENTNKKRATALFVEANTLEIKSEEGVYSYIVCALSTNKPLTETALYSELRTLPTQEAKIKRLKREMWTIIQYQRRARGK